MMLSSACRLTMDSSRSVGGGWARASHGSVLLAVWLWIPLAAASVGAQVRDDRPMELSGISTSEAFPIQDDLELDANAPIINRSLYQLKKASIESRQQYAGFSREISWDALLTDTVDYRFWLFDRPARVRWIETVPVRDAPADAEIQKYHIAYATVSVTDGEQAGPAEDKREIWLTIITRTKPRELPLNQVIDEPIRFEGFLYARTAADQARTRGADFEVPQRSLVFLANGFRWYPDSTQLASPAQVSLAQLGFDVALLDDVRRQNGRGLTRADSEAFFQMLAAVKRTQSSGGIAGLPIPRVTLVDVLTQPQKNLGNAVQFSGSCRTCTRIEVPYPEIKQRLGIDHYYQLSLFPDLGKKVTVSEGERSVTYDRYPVTVCCAQLPDGLTPEEATQRRFSIDGFFFRIWKYESAISSEAGVEGTNSPLVLAAAPVVLTSSTAALNRYVLIFVLGVIAAIGILMIYLRSTAKSQPSYTESLLDELPDRIDIPDLD